MWVLSLIFPKHVYTFLQKTFDRILNLVGDNDNFLLDNIIFRKLNSHRFWAVLINYFPYPL